MVLNFCCILKVLFDSYNDLNMNGFQVIFRVVLKLKFINRI